jgi:hypothetical protein
VSLDDVVTDIFRDASRKKCTIQVREHDINRFEICLSKGWLAQTETLSIVPHRNTVSGDSSHWQRLGNLIQTRGLQLKSLRNIKFLPPYRAPVIPCLLKSLQSVRLQALGASQPTSPLNLKAPFFPTSCALNIFPSILDHQALSTLHLGLEPDPTSPELRKSKVTPERGVS